MDGKLLGSVKYAVAPIGKTVTGTKELPKTTKPGKHQFKNVVDPKNQINESNEKNNIKTEDRDLPPLVAPYLELVKFELIPNHTIAPIDSNGKVNLRFPVKVKMVGKIFLI